MNLLLDAIKGIFGVFWEFIEAFVFAAAIFVVAYLFIFQPNQVKGRSMFPTFHDGEYIFTDKISYRMGLPKRGDVVVFRSPKNNDIDFIKRIIGLPGERIKISGGKVFVDGQLLDESNYLDRTVFTGPESFLAEGQEITIASERYFVMGDNRSQSSDSRDFGPVTPTEFVGKVFFRYWPVERFGKIESGIYPNLQTE